MPRGAPLHSIYPYIALPYIVLHYSPIPPYFIMKNNISPLFPPTTLSLYHVVKHPVAIVPHSAPARMGAGERRCAGRSGPRRAFLPQGAALSTFSPKAKVKQPPYV